MSQRSRFWSNRWTPGQILILAVLAVLFLLMVYPFFYVLFLAVMPYANYVSRPVHLWPDGFTAMYFQEIFKERQLATGFAISIAKTVIGAALAVVVTAMAGYALSRKQLRFARALTVVFIVPMFFTGGIIPFYLTIQAIGLLDSFWAMIIPFLVAPIWIFVSRAYFMDYPTEIIESAIIDGAGQVRAFWSIVWPTSTPLLATLAVMYGTAFWNEYFWSRLLVKPDLWPATAHLYTIMQTRQVLQGLGLGQQLTEQSFIAAVAAMLIIPVLIVYPLLQRYVVKGIMVGAVKG